MNKNDRQLVFDKYGGRCAYCGCELQKGWHVDEKEPCVRIFEIMPAYFNGKKWVPSKKVWTGKYEYPERLNIDNQMPACASCNINKHSGSLEDFRRLIQGFKKHLNEINTQYKISKRYGLVIEIDKPVVFYFETLTIPPPNPKYKGKYLMNYFYRLWEPVRKLITSVYFN